MRRSRTTIAILVSGLAVSVAALTGCSAGQHTATATDVPAVPGTNADAGPAGLRDGLVAFNAQGYEAGADASIIVRLFNNSSAPLILTRVSSPMAKEVRLVGGPSASPSPPASPPASASPSSSASPSGSASTSESPSAPGSPSPQPSPTKAGTTAINVVIPAFGKLELVPGGGGQYLLLTGLSGPVAPGYVVPVSFTFRQTTSAGSQTFTMDNIGLPMAPPPEPGPRTTVDIAPAE